MNQILSKLAQNKHTSGAAVAYVATVGICRLGTIWFPGHQAQFAATEEVLKSVAVGYGLFMAGDAKTNNENQNPK